MDRQGRSHCMGSTFSKFESSGFLLVVKVKGEVVPVLN
jgi:hypothetical protein